MAFVLSPDPNFKNSGNKRWKSCSIFGIIVLSMYISRFRILQLPPSYDDFVKELNRRMDQTEAEDLSGGNFAQMPEVRSWPRNREKSSSTAKEERRRRRRSLVGSLLLVEEGSPNSESKTSGFMQTDGGISSSETCRRNSV